MAQSITDIRRALFAMVLMRILRIYDDALAIEAKGFTLAYERPL